MNPLVILAMKELVFVKEVECGRAIDIKKFLEFYKDGSKKVACPYKSGDYCVHAKPPTKCELLGYEKEPVVGVPLPCS